MRVYYRYFCYGTVVTSFTWGFILVMYFQMQPMQAPPGMEKQWIHRRYKKIESALTDPKNVEFALQEKNRGFHRKFGNNNVVNDDKEFQQQPGSSDKQSNLDELGMIHSPEDQQYKNEGFKLFAFNVLVSDRLSLRREVPDVRPLICSQMKYPMSLPTASIIMCFYNEAWSTLLRSVWSILDKTPSHLLHEIILIDDKSDIDDMGKKLEAYIKNNFTKVKLVRTDKREGLIRARLLGADHASGDVLVFLDSHIEVNKDWLQPLLSRIHENRTTVTIPVIDVINYDTFRYEASPLVRGGFNWGLHYRWDRLPPAAEVSNIINQATPVKTPTMAGGLFAINRTVFNDYGRYDAGMDIWGGENLEMSFRMWQCGGQLEILPCSRVGHVFRRHRPYSNPDGRDSMLYNSLRAAHVWMDDYKEHFFNVRSEARTTDYGDITERLELRKRLKCKSFSWYLEHIYPEQNMPDEKGNGGAVPKGGFKKEDKPRAVKEGHLFHVNSRQCVVSAERIYDKRSMLKLQDCDQQNKDQIWTETEKNSFMLARTLCLDLDTSQVYPRIMKCHFSHGTQEWKWIGQLQKQLLNPGGGKCLSVSVRPKQIFLSTDICDEDNPKQRFEMSLEVVSRYRHPQHQVSENDLDL